MKVNGTYTFQISRDRVFDALLDPQILQATIPGCGGAWYSEDHDHMKVRIVTPVPGLEGPYDIMIRILEQEKPEKLVLQVGREGRIGGTIATVTHITLSEEPDGSSLAYETTAEMQGPVAAVNNPIFVGLAKQSLKTFFKKLNAALVAA